MSELGILGKDIPGRGLSKCNGVEVECWQVRPARPVCLGQD